MIKSGCHVLLNFRVLCINNNKMFHKSKGNEIRQYCDFPQPPHAHVRLSLGREPVSTELGSGERDACPLIRVCFCLGALLRSGIAWYLYITLSFLSSAVTRLMAAPVRFICTIASVTLLGSFIRRSTRDRVQLPVPSLL
jgi:hypothetical protein